MATSIGKLNVTNIKSPLGGGKTPIHKLNFTSGLKVGSNKFAGTPAQLGDTAKFNISRIDDIISLEDRAKLSEQKISSLTRILSLQKKNKKKERDQLTEINDSLKDIGNALALDFANRITEEKQELNLGKDQIRKDKLSFKEKLLESGKRMGETIKKTTATIAAPALGIFGRIFEFLKTVFTGALIGKSLDWLSDEKSAEKLKTFFDRIKENLPTFGRIAGAAGILLFLGKIAPILSTITTAVTGLTAGLVLFANPLTWKILAAVALGALIWRGGKWISEQIHGGEEFVSARDRNRRSVGVSETFEIEIDGRTYKARVHPTQHYLFNVESGKPISTRNVSGDIEGWTNQANKSFIIYPWTKRPDGSLYFDAVPGGDVAFQNYKKVKAQIKQMQEEMGNKIKTAKEAYWDNAKSTKELDIAGGKFDSTDPKTFDVIKGKEKDWEKYHNARWKIIEDGIREDYAIQLRKLVPRFTGGSFSSGIDYLVGENGPEIARFSGSGTIERSGRTAQLLKDFDSGSGINIIPFDLPTIKASAPKLSSNTKATVANDIVTYSSVNITNPYMVEVPEIFGITV